MKEFTAKTVDDAIELGLKELGLTRDQAEIVVIEQPTKGFMGIGAKPAKVSISKIKTDADRAIDFLDGLFDILNLDVATKIELDTEEKIIINLTAIDSSPLIGYRGEVLDSLQCLCGAVANKTNETYKRVVVDCENYREKREQTLKALAEKLANKAIKTSRKITLEPMNPFERRVIHSTLADFDGVKTVSEGKEPVRYIVIIPDNYNPSNRDRKPFKNGSKKRGDGDRRDSRPQQQKAPKKSGFGGGVFLGNSLKDKPTEE